MLGTIVYFRGQTSSIIVRSTLYLYRFLFVLQVFWADIEIFLTVSIVFCHICCVVVIFSTFVKNLVKYHYNLCLPPSFDEDPVFLRRNKIFKIKISQLWYMKIMDSSIVEFLKLTKSMSLQHTFEDNNNKPGTSRHGKPFLCLSPWLIIVYVL